MLGLSDPSPIAAAAHAGQILIILQPLLHDFACLNFLSRFQEVLRQKALVLQARRDPGELTTTGQGSSKVTGLTADFDEGVPGLMVAPARMAGDEFLQKRHGPIGMSQTALAAG